jgi:hypothetical protein
MKGFILKGLKLLVWIVTFPLAVLVLGVFVWFTCFIDYLNE